MRPGTKKRRPSLGERSEEEDSEEEDSEVCII